MSDNLAHDVAVEDRKAWRAHRLEGAKAVIQFATIAIRGVILINGAAVVGILAFLGNLWTKDSPMAKATAEAVGPATNYFVIGVALGVLTAMLAYLSQVTIIELPQPKPGRDPYIGTVFRAAAILCAIASLGLFAWGAHRGVEALGRHPGLADLRDRRSSHPQLEIEI
jgi:hypothetical protein